MIKVLVAGDFCPVRQFDDTVFDQVKDVFCGNDLNVVNFECSLLFGGEKPIVKEGPSLGCDYKQFEQLTKIPVNLLALANNHTLDYGILGLRNVMDEAKSLKIDTVGAGMSLDEAQKTYFFQAGEHVVAIINCCDNEFSVAYEKHGGTNGMDTVRIFYQIQQAKMQADAVVLIAHGGHEYYQLPSPRTQELYRFFIDAGANAVVAHHPHCFSGMEKYGKGLIFYSLGNFCFDDGKNEHTDWNDGFLLQLQMDWCPSLTMRYEIVPYTQCLHNKKVVLKGGSERGKFFEDFKRLSTIISDKALLQSYFEDFVKTVERKSVARLLPYSNRFLVALYKRGLLSSFLKKHAWAGRLNAIQCEAHREVLVKILRDKIG